MDFFDTNYTGDPNFRSNTGCSYEDGVLETYDDEADGIDDLTRVMAHNQTHPRNVWTIVDTDNGLRIIAGCHYVNRFLYFISNEEWTDENEEYEW
jgi:hypothetical protein